MSAGLDSRTPPARTPPAQVPSSPTAQRHARRRWRDPRLVVGIALVALSVVAGARLLAGADDTVPVWSARTSLAAGHRLAPGDLVRRQVRFGAQADADRYLSAAAPVPAGAVLRREVGSGELLPRAAVTGRVAHPATEVPLAVDSEAVPATVRVGSVVDVWVAPDPGAAGARAGGPATNDRATLVFHDVTVVAVPRSSTALGPSATRQVIVGVDGEQEGRLSEALAQLARGSVLLTRRH